MRLTLYFILVLGCLLSPFLINAQIISIDKSDTSDYVKKNKI